MSAVADPFQALFASCPEMLLVAGQDGALLHLNDALSRGVGPIGERATLVELAHVEDRDDVSARWQQLRSGEQRVELSCRLKGADGSYHRYTCSLWTAPGRGEIYGALRPASDGAAPGASARPASASPPAELGRDTPGVTPEGILRAILDNLPIVVWVIDRTGRYLFSEGKALASVGLAPGQVVGRNMSEFAPGILDPGTPLSRALDGESIHEINNHVGAWWENWDIPIADEHGSIISVAGVSLDVTASKRTEQDLLAKIELIERQQEVIREIGMPIIEVWDGVLALPMIGLIDSRRAAEMMERLLEALPMIGLIDSRRAAEMMERLLETVSRRRARYTILDLTGVSTVDSATASHLVSLTRAVQLLGTQSVITGIGPSVAQTMVTLGLDLASILTLANLREGIKYCIAQARQKASVSEGARRRRTRSD